MRARGVGRPSQWRRDAAGLALWAASLVILVGFSSWRLFRATRRLQESLQELEIRNRQEELLFLQLRERSIDLLPKAATLVGIDEQTALIRDPDGDWHTAGVGSVSVYTGRETTRFSAGKPVDALA